MDVTVVRSGGFTGITRTWRTNVAATVVQACPWDAPTTGTEAADRFTYEISITDGRSMTLHESDAVGPWHTLISRVLTSGNEIGSDGGSR